MAAKFKILIIEDEYFTWRQLSKSVQELGYEVLGNGVDLEANLDLLHTGKPDLVLLDINLGVDHTNGLHIGEYLSKNADTPFIYVTAYETDEITQRAISTQPSSYLTKPFKPIELKVAIELALISQNTNNKNDTLIIRDNDFYVHVPIRDIKFMESEGNYLKLFTIKKTYRYRQTIKGILASLPATLFMQTHRAFIINVNYVTKFNNDELAIGAHLIPISEKFRDEVLKTLRARS